jgi:hypothetical protein
LSKVYLHLEPFREQLLSSMSVGRPHKGNTPSAVPFEASGPTVQRSVDSLGISDSEPRLWRFTIRCEGTKGGGAYECRWDGMSCLHWPRVRLLSILGVRRGRPPRCGISPAPFGRFTDSHSFRQLPLLSEGPCTLVITGSPLLSFIARVTMPARLPGWCEQTFFR